MIPGDSKEPRSPLPQIPGFEILRLIGRGGMGEVYVARQQALGRLVAIKILITDGASGLDERLARFRREAELMARVSHPNVLTVFDSGIVAGRPYLVMEYVEGGDLRKIMVQGVPLPIGQARVILRPVGEALACLHRHGILHRDLKPENILMHDEGNPLVTDFGLAVLRAGGPETCSLAIGTLGYVAPEQQYRLKVDERADQYSLACLAYELLTGQKPLGIIAPPSRLHPRLGLRVDSVLMRALQEDPSERFSSIREFSSALDASLSALSDAAPVAAHPGRRWIVVLPIVAALLVGSGVAIWMALRAGLASEDKPADAPRTPDDPAVPKPALGPAPVIVNSLGMRLVRITPGEFFMGSPASDPDAWPAERPQQLVKVEQPFYLGAHEVTVGQFRQFVEATGYTTEAELGGGGIFDPGMRRVVMRPGLDWREPGFEVPVDENDPVVQVSWNDARAFCAWLSQREGEIYRLPTEAEWELACRAGTSTRWSFGDDPSMLGRYGWYNENAPAGPRQVGTLRPNAWGLYDMHGNVWEWCLEPVDRPFGIGKGTPNPAHRFVVRGGGWHWTADRTRSASRFPAAPDYRYQAIGFRVCLPEPEVDRP